MFMEFQFEVIVFGIFPFKLVGAEMVYAFSFWPNNSVEDIIDMLMQMLEESFTQDMSSLQVSVLFKGT